MGPVDRLGQGHPGAPHLGQLEDVEAALDVLAGPQHSLAVLEDGGKPLAAHGHDLDAPEDGLLCCVGRDH
eukprot:9512894-Lingulodinium_polyedra.AAC.1